jgi:hypothetical protein
MRPGALSAILLISMCSVVTAGDRYGNWSLETLRGDVLALSYRQLVPSETKIAVAELGFLCNLKPTSDIYVVLVPFEGTYDNHQEDVPVLIQQNGDTFISSDIFQTWRNGYKYLFLNPKDKVDMLVTFLNANERKGGDSAHFFFSGQFDGHSNILNHIVIGLHGFSDGFLALAKKCKP